MKHVLCFVSHGTIILQCKSLHKLAVVIEHNLGTAEAARI